MAVESIHRQADQFAIHLGKFLLQRGEGDKLRCADGRKVGGVAEQNDPMAGVLRRKINLALGRHGLERRGRVADTWHGHSQLLFHINPSLK